MKRTSSDKLSAVIKRAKARREADAQWMTLFEELAHYFHTYRKGFITDYSQAEDLNQDTWSSIPHLARRKLAEFLVACMCPKERVWTGLMPKRRELLKSRAVRLWCEQVGKIMYDVLYDTKVNFTEKIAEIADDAVSLGTAVSYMAHNKKERCLDLQVKYLKNFTFECDGKGKDIGWYCWMDWTLGTLIDEFGLEALPKELQDEWKDANCNPSKCYEVVHIVMKNSEFERYGTGPGRLPLKSIWALSSFIDHGPLDEGGYYTSPYVVSRWYRRSKEAWGRSISMDALPNARLVQSVAGALLEITEKQGNPPMQGPVDILRGEIELFPGGFTAFDSSGFQFQGDPLRPVQVGANPAMTAEYLQYLEKEIDKIFYGDVMRVPEPNGRSTMEDAAAWQQRVAQIVGPVFSRVENELLPPMLDRLFDILLRTNSLPPIPEELEGEDLEYKFDNYIADMRDAAEAHRDMGTVAQSVQLERPEVEENLDFDKFFRGTWSKLRLPIDYVKPYEDVIEAREQRQQMQEAAQMAEIAKSAGPGLKAGVEAVQGMQGQQGLLPAPQ